MYMCMYVHIFYYCSINWSDSSLRQSLNCIYLKEVFDRNKIYQYPIQYLILQLTDLYVPNVWQSIKLSFSNISSIHQVNTY